MFEEIKNKKVLITGANGGIGAAIAELFAGNGASVGIHYYQDKKRALELKRKITSFGGRAEILKEADLTENTSRHNLMREFIQKFGRIDILVNNAGGVYGAQDFLSLDEKSWEKTFALNATAPFFLAQEAFGRMKKQQGGKIINISSVAAKYGGSTTTLHYGAAKAALEAVTKGLARAGAPHNILVNTVRGGIIDTLFHQKIHRTKADLQKRVKLTPLGRAGKPSDIAQMVLFLASEGGDYITGETFTVAGGD
ncbi:MAG: SDR family oxidoreductase [Candidatus Nealsonbacteria bacterium]